MYRQVITAALAAGLFSSAALAGPNDIHIVSATYGDLMAKKTCKPSLSICEGLAVCEFQIDDELCKVPDGATGAKNLMVTFQCGKGKKKNVGGFSGTKMTLIKCP